MSSPILHTAVTALMLLLDMEWGDFFFFSPVNHCLWVSQSACALVDLWHLEVVEHGPSFTFSRHGERLSIFYSS